MVAPRIPYHEIPGVIVTSRGPTAASAANATWTQAANKSTLEALNNENSVDALTLTGNGNEDRFLRIDFPEAWDISAYYVSMSNENNTADNEIWYLPSGGSWTLWHEHAAFYSDDPLTEWKSGIVTPGSPITNVVAIAAKGRRFTTNLGVRAAHFYGSPNSTSGKLRLWHATLDQEYGSAIDFGTLNPGNTSTVQFRIKNLHSSQANGIVLDAYALHDDLDTGMTFSDDNTTYTATLNIGNLAASAISGTLYVRRVVPDPTDYETKAAWISAIPTSWS